MELLKLRLQRANTNVAVRKFEKIECTLMLLKKNVFSSCLERGTKSLNEESNLAPSHSAL